MDRVVPALLAALAVAAALAVLPGQLLLGEESTGDSALAGNTRATLDTAGRIGVSVATVDSSGVRVAGLGTADGAPVTGDTRFQTASVAKPLTGMLLADAVRRGEVRPSTTLAEIYGARVRGALRAVTVGELGSHRSGLPRDSAYGWFRGTVQLFGGSVYFGASQADILGAANESRLAPRGDYAYSNLGMALLGNALAEREGTDYPTLLRKRLLSPLGMRDTGLLDGARGHDQLGRPVAATAPGAYAPAGPGMYSTAGDLGRLLRAVLRGTAPGMAATEPRYAAAGSDRTGMDWVTSRIGGRELLWHSGGDTGASAFAGISGERGVVLLGNTGRSLTPAGMRLLGLTPPPSVAPVDPQPADPALVTAELSLLLLGCVVPLWTVWRARVRAGVAVIVLGGLAVLALVWSLVPWTAGWTWAAWVLAAGCLGASAGFGFRRRIRWWGARPWVRAPLLALPVVVSVLVLALSATAWL